MAKDKKGSIEVRKESHVRICLDKDVESDVTGGFDDVMLVHHALPDLNKDDIDLSCEFLGKKLKAPLVIEAMTGGAKIAEKINMNLAKAACEVGVAFGVGSVRAAMVDEKLWSTYKVRGALPTCPVLSNIGLVQLIDDYDIRDIKDSLKKMGGADGIAIHLNALQEAVQGEGNVRWKGSFSRLKYFCQNLSLPVVVKETGSGISRETAIILEKSGAAMIDIGGLGGTSFGMVEYYRDKEGQGEMFKNWGIPTACSVAECRSAVKIPIIASGGIRNGIDAAKAIALGADYAGVALPLLSAATKSHKDVVAVLLRIIDEMRSCMFLCGAKSVDELKRKDVVILGRTREWLQSRGIRLDNISNRESIEMLREKVKF
ncbi:MAG: type 2 isopentenyl-diphosphate Delta-isomerase [archaeon]|nr:type 2 isopentenyl-diphosphate Delta-isomerase [archaeon]